MPGLPRCLEYTWLCSMSWCKYAIWTGALMPAMKPSVRYRHLIGQLPAEYAGLARAAV